MSRRHSPSLQVRGVPRDVLDRIDATAAAGGRTRNTAVLETLRGYAEGLITPRAAPAPFDPLRPRAAPYGPDTTSLAISGIPADVWQGFQARARADGWLSKNELIITLLREQGEA